MFFGAASLAALAYLPYIPREGDAFGCWFNYSNNLHNFGLINALENADASGRHPGYPFFISLVMNYLNFDFLDTLRILRIIFILATLSAFYFFIKSVINDKLKSSLSALLILFIPTCWGSITLNTQDSIKIFSLIFSLLFFIKIIDSDRKSDKKIHYILFSFFSILLASSRWIEALPMYGFIFIYINRKHPELNFKSHFTKTLKYLIPSLFFIFSLHVIGYIAAGHWSVSAKGAGSPSVWLKLAIHHIKINDTNIFVRLLDLGYLSVANVFNKVGYFIEHFFLSKDVNIVMYDVNAFFNGFQQTSTFKYFATYPLVVLFFAFFIKNYLDKKNSSIIKALIIAIFISFLFYTFGLNHYEPRYWLIVFSSVMLVFVFKYYQFRFFNIIAITLLILFSYINFNNYSNMKIQDDYTNSQILNWRSEIIRLCTENTKTVFIDDNYFSFSSFKYFAKMDCPNLIIKPISFKKADDIKYPSLTIDFLKKTNIIGL